MADETNERDEGNRSIELTREKLLTGLGAIGAAGASAGLGTSALFSDSEQFANNELTAGTLNLRVTAEVVKVSEYFSTDGAGPNLVGSLGTADGAVVTGLQVNDFKPGDWVILCFEISVEGNPGYVWISADEFAQYENGQTEPEAAVDDSPGGSLGMPLDGLGQGELQDELRVEVYNDYDETQTRDPPRSYLTNKRGDLSGTAKTVFNRLDGGALIGDPSNPTEIGPDNSPFETYVLLDLPKDVGNEVQNDAVTFDLVFKSEQSRHNKLAAATRMLETDDLSRGETTNVTFTIELGEASDISVFERLEPIIGQASFEGATLDDESIPPSFVDLGEGGGIVLFDGVGPGELTVEYSLSVAADAPTGAASFEPNLIDVDERAVPVDGAGTIEVIT